ncbi:MAG: TlpA family protein disulfide reductase [Bacteroidota bacterium]
MTNKGMKCWLFVISLISLASCTSFKETKPPEELKGLWFDSKTNQWGFKLDESIVFWENRIEEIEKFERSKNEYRITTPSRSLKFKHQGDSISIDGSWYLKNYSGIIYDSTHFEQITERGIVVVQGIIEQIDPALMNKPFKVQVIDFLLGRELEYLSEVDSNGFFKVEFEVHGTQDILLGDEYFDRWRRLIVSPNDTLTINIPVAKQIKNVHFSGRNAHANYDIFYMNETYNNYKPDYKAVNNALGYEPSEYIEFRRKYRKADQKFLKEYCEGRECSTLFKEWFKNNSEVEYYSNLMKFSWQSLNYGLGSSQRLTGDLKENYEKEFMDSIEYTSQTYRLSASYFGLINGISHRLLDYSDENTRSFKMQEIDFLLKDELILSEDDKSFLRKYEGTGLDIENLNQSQKEIWWSIEDKMADKLQNFRRKLSYDFYVRDMSKFEYDDPRDILISQHFYGSILENRNFEIMDWAHDRLLETVGNKSYSKYLSSIYSDIKKQERSIGDLKIPALKYDGSGKQLLEKIKNDNPGKKILIDFWGTWCQPCLTDFEVTRKLKDNVSKVKFVYLCVNSSEKNWKNALIKYNPKGDHYLLTQRQTYELLEYFNINSFPTYILMDSKGKYKNDVPRPVLEKEFISYLNNSDR